MSVTVTLREIDPEKGLLVNPQHIVAIEPSRAADGSERTVVWMLGARAYTVPASRDIVLLRLSGATR